MNSFYSIVLAAAVAAAPPLSEYSRYESLDNTKVAYGMGVETDSNNRPLGAIRAQKQYGGMGGQFIGGSEEKRLWLTFDEGYENGCTADILDTLKEKNVRAVFFVTYDYCKRNPELVRRMIARGAHSRKSHLEPPFPPGLLAGPSCIPSCRCYTTTLKRSLATKCTSCGLLWENSPSGCSPAQRISATPPCYGASPTPTGT